VVAVAQRRLGPSSSATTPTVERALAKGSRVVVIGRLPGGHSCVLLVWAVLDPDGISVLYRGP
jgi:hypothetical protein